MGFYCTHDYAHTNRSLKEQLPYVLKGLDAIVFATFKHMGLKVSVRPVLGEYDDSEYFDDPSIHEDSWKRPGQDCGDPIGKELHPISVSEVLEDEEPAREVCS